MFVEFEETSSADFILFSGPFPHAKASEVGHPPSHRAVHPAEAGRTGKMRHNVAVH